jgi:hypothetical protein
MPGGPTGGGGIFGGQGLIPGLGGQNIGGMGGSNTFGLPNQPNNFGSGNLFGSQQAEQGSLQNILPQGFTGLAGYAQNTGFLNIPEIMQQLQASQFPAYQQAQSSLSNMFGSNNASFGSEKAIGASNLGAQYAGQLAGAEAGLYEQQAQNQLGVFGELEGQEATYKANQASPWDYISGILGIGSAGAGAYNQIQQGNAWGSLAAGF